MAMTSARPFRLGFIMARPTQFEAPFFKFISSDESVRTKVLYLYGRKHSNYDPEIEREVSWGFDLYEGYDHAEMPASGWFKWLLNSVTRNNFDVVIINGYYSLPLLTAALIARMRGIRVALRLDAVEFEAGEVRNSIRRSAKRILYRLYDHFFAVSSLTMSLLRRLGISPGRVSYFTYAVDVDSLRRSASAGRLNREELRARYQIPSHAKVVLAVSKLSPRETPWDLLHVFQRTILPDTVLLVAGDGPDRDAIEQFVSESLRGRAFLAGYIPYPELPLLYAIVDLYVHAASNEPWGVSVAEAMACGLPVIASSRVGSGYDLISEGQNGFRYESGNVNDLAEKLDLALRLNRDDVAKKNLEILSAWDYRASWNNILKFCSM